MGLSNKVATLSGVVLSGVGAHTITATYAGVPEQYTSSTGQTTISLSKASVTAGRAQLRSPISLTSGQTGSVTITVTAPYTTIAPPSGSLSYSILNASATSVASGTLTLTAGSGSSTATVPIPGTPRARKLHH